MLNYLSGLKKLDSLGQQHLLDQWNFLNLDEQQRLLLQIEQLDFEVLKKQLNFKEPEPKNHSYSPFEARTSAGNQVDEAIGKTLIQEGKVACLVIAGGQGTRLGFDGPKGCFPISLYQHKSFFQMLSEKTLAAGKQAGVPLHLIIMTSPLNHQQTVAYFENYAFFGLAKEQIHFFSQGLLPFLEGDKLFLESPAKIAQGPNGNGLTLKAFWESGIGPLLKEKGVEFISSVLIDNPLADPFDAELIGFHARLGNEVTVKCIEKIEPQEMVGVLVWEKNHVKVIEYSELPRDLCEALQENGKLLYSCANISLFCWSISFIAAHHQVQLPLHRCLKKSKSLNPPYEKQVWKFEYFIFDLLAQATKIQALLYPRSRTFSPLKNREGIFSPERVQNDMSAYDLEILKKLTGLAPLCSKIELAAEFHYPTPALRDKWRSKSVQQNGYLNP